MSHAKTFSWCPFKWGLVLNLNHMIPLSCIKWTFSCQLTPPLLNHRLCNLRSFLRTLSCPNLSAHPSTAQLTESTIKVSSFLPKPLSSPPCSTDSTTALSCEPFPAQTSQLTPPLLNHVVQSTVNSFLWTISCPNLSAHPSHAQSPCAISELFPVNPFLPKPLSSLSCEPFPAKPLSSQLPCSITCTITVNSFLFRTLSCPNLSAHPSHAQLILPYSFLRTLYYPNLSAHPHAQLTDYFPVNPFLPKPLSSPLPCSITLCNLRTPSCEPFPAQTSQLTPPMLNHMMSCILLLVNDRDVIFSLRHVDSFLP
jgi:hypothetical protein